MRRHQAWRRCLLFAAALVLAALGCNLSINLNPDHDERVVQTDGPWYDIYFTDPQCPPVAQRSGGIDEIIARDLLRAQTSVDIAAYDLDAEPIVNALIAVRARGLPVRAVTDSDNEDLSSVRRLRRNGISVVTDGRVGLMHNKFIVVDERAVWTGSLNYTSNGAYCNNNLAVRFELPDLAANYRAEMDEMFVERQFGPTSPIQSLPHRIVVNDAVVESYFAPEQDIPPVVAAVIAQAQEEVLFMAFSFTEELIGSAMLDRALEGVEVRGVFETFGSETPFSYFGRMRDARLPNLQVRQDGNPRIMHHKVIIVDGEVVILGSFNFSRSANEANDENIMIVRDAEFASYFIEEFDWVWVEAR